MTNQQAKIAELMPGDRVMAFDCLLYLDDIRTPLTVTVKPATVLRRYGRRSDFGWLDPDLVDLRFDHRESESRGHFTEGVVRMSARYADELARIAEEKDG